MACCCNYTQQKWEKQIKEKSTYWYPNYLPTKSKFITETLETTRAHKHTNTGNYSQSSLLYKLLQISIRVWSLSRKSCTTEPGFPAYRFFFMTSTQSPPTPSLKNRELVPGLWAKRGRPQLWWPDKRREKSLKEQTYHEENNSTLWSSSTCTHSVLSRNAAALGHTN